ncbi:uncharacterized protein JCM15063_003232 [Sporobolomyces koalae]|uniref:uncharacterized protein n=1 Tax=Sporobolomyces koalae TaxID=500713 RepID=UPI0031739A1D
MVLEETRADDATLIQPRAEQPRRPALNRNTSSYASQPGSAGCRLLWRGAIATADGYKLYGVAIIAHLFSVPSAASASSPHAAAATTPNAFSPFDDPFSSTSKANSSGADMCLGLEMLRGKDLNLVEPDQTFVVQQVLEPLSTNSSPETSRSSAVRKGKAKADPEVVKVETPTDVRVYIDERCTDTVEWFQDQFCREGCQGRGIKLDAGGERIVIFAQLPQVSTTSTNSPSTSSTEQPLPPLTLLLGRPFKPVVRKPRPDDPLPRESLFTAKLRKTASLPAAAFSKTSLASSTLIEEQDRVKKRRLSSKDKAIASLMSKTNADTTTSLSRSRQVSNPPPSIAFPFPVSSNSTATTNSKRSLSRSLSTSNATSNLFSSNLRQGSLPPSSSFNGHLDRPGHRAFKRSQSSISTTSSSNAFLRSGHSPPPPEHDEDDVRLLSMRDRRNSRSGSVSRAGSRAPPSPSFSIASTTLGLPGMNLGEGFGVKGEEETHDHGDEVFDRLAEIKEIGIKRQRKTNGIGARPGRDGNFGLERSLSVPVGGKFLDSHQAIKVEQNGETFDPRIEGQTNPIETRNKNTVKKMTMMRLQHLGISKDHVEFKELFSMVTRGVGFALRSIFKEKVLDTVERATAEDLIDHHLKLYLPALFAGLFALVKSPKPLFDATALPAEDQKVELDMRVKEDSSDTVIGDEPDIKGLATVPARDPDVSNGTVMSN